MIKVSIIIPVYNLQEYIADCLESVMFQTLEEIEIICINDGSEDNSLEIIEEYQKKDGRIVVISQENKGLSVARNVGIHRAKGKYVIFLDGDDKLNERALEILYKMLERHTYDILYFSACAFTGTEESEYILNEVERLKKYYKRNLYILEPVEGGKAYVDMWRKDKFLVSACLQIVRKSYLEKNNYKFCEGILHEDNLYTFFTLLNANRVGCIDLPLYERRVRSNSIMTSKSTYKNVLGLYFSYDVIYLNYSQLEFKQSEVLDNIYLFMDRLFCESLRIYNSLSDTEKEKFISCLDERQKKAFFIKSNMQEKSNRIVDLEGRIKEIESQNKWLVSEKERLEKSISYKVGRSITWLPRVIRRKGKG